MAPEEQEALYHKIAEHNMEIQKAKDMLMDSILSDPNLTDAQKNKKLIVSGIQIPAKESNEYLPRDVFVEVLIRVADGSTIKEAWTVVCEDNDLDVQKTRSTASRVNHSQEMIQSCVESVLERDQYGSMLSDLKIPRTVFQGLSRPSTAITYLCNITALAREITNLRTDVDNLKKQNIDHSNRIQTLEAQMAYTDAKIAQMSDGLGVPSGIDDKIAFYKQKGLTQQQVADTIGKSLRTVQRKWNE